MLQGQCVGVLSARNRRPTPRLELVQAANDDDEEVSDHFGCYHLLPVGQDLYRCDLTVHHRLILLSSLDCKILTP